MGVKAGRAAKGIGFGGKFWKALILGGAGSGCLSGDMEAQEEGKGGRLEGREGLFRGGKAVKKVEGGRAKYERRVLVNEEAVSDAQVERAEEKAGSILPGEYW